MKLRHLVAVAISIFMLSACSVPASKYAPIKTSIAEPASIPETDMNDPQAVAREVTTERDDFEKKTDYLGPGLTANNGWPVCFFTVIVLKYDDGRSFGDIYIDDSYYGEDWRLYDRAFDSNGNSLTVSIFDRKREAVSGEYIYSEIIEIKVPLAYLEGSQQSGLKFKIAGKRGERILSIPAGYIKGLLSVANRSQ